MPGFIGQFKGHFKSLESKMHHITFKRFKSFVKKYRRAANSASEYTVLITVWRVVIEMSQDSQLKLGKVY